MRRAWLAVPAALVLAGAGGTAVVLQTRPAPAPLPAPSPTPEPVRTPLLVVAPPGSLPSSRLLAAALAPRMKDKALGPGVLLSVVDVTTGRSLLDVDGSRAAAPASTAKLVTAVAALTVLGPDRTITTQVVAGRPGDVVLVGGGDPTLAGADAAAAAASPSSARLADLARQLQGVAVRRVVVDDTLFTGPRTGPAWKPGYVTMGNVSPVSALSVDEGRTSTKEHSPRTSDPAMAAGRQLARLLGARTVVRGRAAPGARVLALVESPPVSDLVEQMLTHSDNDLAEALGRLVALAEHRPATFQSEAAALAAVLPGAGGLRDASGLSPLDRLRPTFLTRLLVRAATDPRLAPVVAGLPVAGFDGTLKNRFRKPPAATGAGDVRAKTGTLDGVSTLAGLVRTSGGRLLAFAVTADAVPMGGTLASQAALDRLAATIATCRCG